MLITKVSQVSGKTHAMDIPVTEAQLALWRSGTLIQYDMPNLTSDQREFLMPGITAEEWDDLFGDEEWT